MHSMMAPPAPSQPAPVSPKSKANNRNQPTNLLKQDIEKMGFIQLKARCGMEGLSTFGTKKQLLGRMRHHLKSQKKLSKKNKKKIQSNKNKIKMKNISSNSTVGSSSITSSTSSSTNAKNFRRIERKNKVDSDYITVTGSQGTAHTFYDNPDEDPELRDLDPKEDDMYSHLIPTNVDDSDVRAGSIIVHREQPSFCTRIYIYIEYTHMCVC